MLLSQNVNYFRTVIFKFGFIFLAILILSFQINTKNVYSFNITLSWDFPKELKTQINGYKVFSCQEGETFNGQDNKEIKDPSKKPCTMHDSDNNSIYSVVVEAFDLDSSNKSPNSNYSGSENLSFKVNDVITDSESADVSIIL